MSILIFIYTIHFANLMVYTNFENTGSNRSLKSVTEIVIGEKEKWSDKQNLAVFCNTIQFITI